MAEENQEQSRAPFNMALNTLERLGKILDQIKMISSITYLDKTIQQTAKLKLLKQFFIQSAPLLPSDFVKKHTSKILNLKMIEKIIINNSSIPIGTKSFFDDNIEIQIDNYLINIQLSLQEEGYFMPQSEEDELY